MAEAPLYKIEYNWSVGGWDRSHDFVRDDYTAREAAAIINQHSNSYRMVRTNVPTNYKFRVHVDVVVPVVIAGMDITADAACIAATSIGRSIGDNVAVDYVGKTN